MESPKVLKPKQPVPKKPTLLYQLRTVVKPPLNPNYLAKGNRKEAGYM